MKSISIDKQEIIIPDKEDWNTDEFSSLFRGWNNFDYGGLYSWLEEHSKYRGVTIGIIGHPGRCTPIALIKIDEEFHRVHIENVICEHCDKRSGVSGTPGVWSLYFGCENPNDELARSMSLPTKACVHCGGALKRRHTIWFENE